MIRTLKGCILILGLILTAYPVAAPAAVIKSERPPRIEHHSEDEFDQVLRENALFFSILVSFSYTAAFAEPAWGVGVKNINLNLVTRAVRDPQGRQLVRVRVAGNVRSNNNVELDLLDENGSLVGKGFFGYYSGQLTFYDRESRAIIEGYIDVAGNYELLDLRLPEGKRDLASGYVDPCFYCGSMPYAWYDGTGAQVGGGRIIPDYYASSAGNLPVYWSFERGYLSAEQPAYGEADYTLRGETTGAINSVLFDTPRTADSFFANPYSLVPQPAGKSYLPRVTDNTGIAVINPSERQIEVTYVARHYNGALVAGDGIENPVTYSFDPGVQYAAYPGEIFRQENDRRPIFGDREVGWIEVFSYEGDVQALFLAGDVEGRALDGNIGCEDGDASLVFPDLKLSPGENTEINLLNLSFDDVMVRLELLDRSGLLLREEVEFFISGYGIRTFHLGSGSDFLSIPDPDKAASLRVTCNNDNSIKSTSCSRLIGMALYKDRFQSTATSYAVTPQSAGAVLLGTHFAAGPSGSGFWQTSVYVAKLDGGAAPVYLDIYDRSGNLLQTLQETVSRSGQAAFRIGGPESPWRDILTTGYLRLRSDEGRIGGAVAIQWSDGQRSTYSSYPLVGYIYSFFRFNQVAHGSTGQIEYWTGLAFLNDLDRQVDLTIEVFRPDGALDRSATLALQAYAQVSALLSEILQDPSYLRLDGYMVVRATDPISAIVLYGDTGNQFLAAVPGVPR